MQNTNKILFILASVMVILFLATTNEVKAQNKTLNSITVPISLSKLTDKLGKRHSYIDEDPFSGSSYVWKFQNGLIIDASFGGDDEEKKKIFGVIIFSAKSKKIIQNCPFDFVLNKTTFSEVNSRFNNKLQKLDYRNDEFKAYSNKMWNHFKFKNKILIEITLATFAIDTVS